MLLTDKTSPIFELIQSSRQTEDEGATRERDRGSERGSGVREVEGAREGAGKRGSGHFRLIRLGPRSCVDKNEVSSCPRLRRAPAISSFLNDATSGTSYFFVLKMTQPRALAISSFLR